MSISAATSRSLSEFARIAAKQVDEVFGIQSTHRQTNIRHLDMFDATFAKLYITDAIGILIVASRHSTNLIIQFV